MRDNCSMCELQNVGYLAFDNDSAEMKSLREERLQNDLVTIICKNDTTIFCSRQKLAKFSNYFRALFYGNFVENSQPNVFLKCIEAEYLELLLRFCDSYHGRKYHQTEPRFCRIPIETYEESWRMLEIADRLALDNATTECDLYIIESLTSELCLEVCHLSEIFLRFSIMQHAVRMWSLQRKRTHENLIKQSLRNEEIILHKLTDGTTICSSCGEEVLRTSPKTCMCYFKTQYHESDYFYIIGGYFWKQMTDCYRIKTEDFFNCIDAEYSSECIINTKKLTDSNLLEVGGKDDTEGKDESKEESKFKSAQSFPGSYNEECRVVALGTDVYVCGGLNDKSSALSEVWKYDTRLNEWERVSNMRHKRFYHCIAPVGDHIFVCGGYNEHFVLDSLERYHPLYNEWVDMANMLTGVGNAACAADDFGIYVSCGQYGYKDIRTTNHVQHYEINTNQWSLLTKYESPVFYPHSEYGLSSVIFNGKLFIVGGQTERCDEYDIKTGVWSRLPDMVNRRLEAAVCVHEDKVLVVGGYDYRKGEHHDTTEIYNPATKTWKVLESRLPMHARSLGVCNIFDVRRKTKL